MLVAPEFAHLQLAEYEYWHLLLIGTQSPFPGRCYAWWRDRSLSDGEGMGPHLTPPDAVRELNYVIFPEVLKALGALGHPVERYGKDFLLNMACYGNEGHLHNHHLHWHFVPRWRGQLRIPGVDLGIPLVDPVWGKHYRSAYVLPPEYEKLKDPQVIEHIHKIMAKAVA